MNFPDVAFVSFVIVDIQVLPLTSDELTESDIDSIIEVGGNSYANSIYEAFLPKRFPKPKSNSSYEERSKFIRWCLYQSEYCI